MSSSDQWQAALSLLERILDGRLLHANPALEVRDLTTDISNRAASLPEPPSPAIQQKLGRLLSKAGKQLGQLSAAQSSAAWGSRDAVLARAGTMFMGLLAVDCCTILAEKSSLTNRKPLQQLAAGAFSLMCGPGRRLLQQQCSDTAVVQQYGSLAVETQLQMSYNLFKFLTKKSSSEEADIAAFCKAAGSPAALLHWLAATGRMLHQAINPGAGPGNHGLGTAKLQRAACNFAFMLKLVTMRVKAVEPYGHALQADSVLAQQLYESAMVVLEATVGQLDAESALGSSGSSSAGHPSGNWGFSQAGTPWQWLVIPDLLSATSSKQFHAALNEHAVRGSGSGAAHLLRQAAAMLHQLQAAGEEEIPVSIRRAVSVATVSLAGTASCALLNLGTAGPSSSPSSRQQAATTVQLVPVAVEALHFLPVQAATLHLLGNDEQAVVQHVRGQLQVMCTMAGFVMDLVMQRDPAAILCEGRHAVAWCSAVDACLRLLPLLVRLQLDWARPPPPQDEGMLQGLDAEQPASKLATSCIYLWLHFLALAASARTGTTLADGIPEANLWQLYTTVCRLVHWAAKLSAPELRVLPPLLTGWDWLLSALHETFLLAIISSGTVSSRAAAQRSGAAAAGIERRLQAMAVAHGLALPLAAGRAGMELGRLETGWCDVDLLCIAASVPANQLSPPVLQAFQSIIRQRWQAASGDAHELAEHVYTPVKAAEHGSLLAVLLLTTGLMAEGLASVKQAWELPIGSSTQQPPILDRLLASLMAICDNLLLEASKQPDKLRRRYEGLDPLPPTAAQQLVHQHFIATAGKKLSSALVACRSSIQPPTSLAGCLQLLRRYQHTLLPPATALAAALAEYWDTPEVRAADELEVAQAVAGRSCANLRCANLEAGGGPGAGQVVGSKKCSACRSVWYCSTACSRANWREGGHKRVCKQLAAARQQRREEGA